ncbi:MAG: hypothetical protein NTY22_09625, partial [Proteobacteria bacterium]|nr:hypothetical protein [Pseudomonadota bacterium]
MFKRLPANPNLENLKNQAKTLLKAHQQSLPEANSRIQEFHPEWSHSSIEQIQNANISLSDAQWVVAREYNHDSWTKLKRYVESRNRLFESRKHLEEMLAKADGTPTTESSWYINSKVEV